MANNVNITFDDKYLLAYYFEQEINNS